MLTLANRLSNMLVYLAIRFSRFIRDATWNTAVRRFWASPSLSVTSEENGCRSWPTLLLARGPQLNFSFGPQRKKSFCTPGLEERSRGQQNIIQPPRMRQISWSRRRFDQFPGRLMKYSRLRYGTLFPERSHPEKNTGDCRLLFFQIVMLYSCPLLQPEAGCHFRIDSLSCDDAGTWPTQREEEAGLKIHLQSQSGKYCCLKGLILTGATRCENDCSSGLCCRDTVQTAFTKWHILFPR